ncbi:MAG: hypothetical protein ACM3U2_22965, partial [Deltaproteobacteria bacterium]
MQPRLGLLIHMADNLPGCSLVARAPGEASAAGSIGQRARALVSVVFVTVIGETAETWEEFGMPAEIPPARTAALHILTDSFVAAQHRRLLMSHLTSVTRRRFLLASIAVGS